MFRLVFISMALMGVSVAGGFALSMSQKSVASVRGANDGARVEMVASRVLNAAPEIVSSPAKAQVLTPLPAEVERLHENSQIDVTPPTASRVIDGSVDVTRASLDFNSPLVAPGLDAPQLAPNARVVVPGNSIPAPRVIAPDFTPIAPAMTLHRSAPAVVAAPVRPRVQVTQVRRSPARGATFPNTLIGVYR